MALKKKVIGLIKLQIQAGSVNSAPPIGPALSRHGVNIMEFCKVYDAQTESMRGSIIPVETTVYKDHFFDFVLKASPAFEMIRKAAGIQKSSGTPNTVKVANLTWNQAAKIAEEKMKDPNASGIEAVKKIIAGTAHSMGVAVS